MFVMNSCVNCGKTDQDGAFLVNLPSHLGQLKACTSCISKFGEATLSLEADQILSKFQPRAAHYCFICKGPVIAEADGGSPLICHACLAEGKKAIAA
jgi:hypothetical protein